MKQVFKKKAKISMDASRQILITLTSLTLSSADREVDCAAFTLVPAYAEDDGTS